jgi:hypothetical protein
MFTAAKYVIVRLFNVFGLDIRRRRPAMRTRVSMTGVLAQLACLGFMPQILIIVDIAYKTSEVCRAFRDASIRFIQLSVELGPFLPVEAKRTLQETRTAPLELTFFGTTIDGRQQYEVVARTKQCCFVIHDTLARQAIGADLTPALMKLDKFSS